MHDRHKLVTYNKTTTHTPTMFFTQVKAIASYTKLKVKGKFSADYAIFLTTAPLTSAP